MGSPTGRARPRVSAVHTMWWCYYRTGRVCRVVLTRAPAQFGDNHFWQEKKERASASTKRPIPCTVRVGTAASSAGANACFATRPASLAAAMKDRITHHSFF